jgi:hypothetical protein
MNALRTSLFCLLLAATSLPADELAEKDKEKAPPTERLVRTGQALGTISNWNDTEGKFTLHVKIQYLEPNVQAQQNYARDLQNLQTRQLQIMQNRNPVQRQQDLIKLLQDAQNLQGKPQNFYSVKEKEITIDVELADDVKVRQASPPALFDEKGNIKAYTPQELKELKGMGEDAKLPGYTGERDSLRNGQTVLVTTGYKTGGKGPVLEAVVGEKKPDPAEKKPDPAEKKLPPAPPRPKVVLIVIVAEPKN